MELQNDKNKITPKWTFSEKIKFLLEFFAPDSPTTFDPTPLNKNSIKEIIRFAVIALIVVIPIRMFIAQPFIVSGASMDPTFKSGEYLIVDQLSYHTGDPARNDVIIFRYPINPKTFFIKRVVGLPGETVKSEAGKITIFNKENPEGIPFDDSHIAAIHKTTDTFSVTLDNKHYFVMGDNRAESSDSRIWGPLERKYIVGRPALRLFPFTKISILPGK